MYTFIEFVVFVCVWAFDDCVCARMSVCECCIYVRMRFRARMGACECLAIRTYTSLCAHAYMRVLTRYTYESLHVYVYIRTYM
jgi:hypothetical protein